MTTAQKSKSYHQLLTAAEALFRKYGIKRVTVLEICKTAEVSKMTFYRLFENKEDLAIATLKQMMDVGIAQYREVMRWEIPFPEKVKALILMKKENSSDISEEILKDVYLPEHTALQAFLQEHHQAFMQEVVGDFVSAQQAGWIRKDIQPGFILYIFQHIQTMMQDDTLYKMYPNPSDLIMELTHFMFYGLMGNTDQQP